MKRALAVLLVLIAWLITFEAKADIEFIVSAANLQDQTGALAPTNSLVLLVADTGGDGFATQLLPTCPLSVGSTLMGTDKPANDRIVAAWDMSSLGTAGQLLNVAKVAFSANQPVALYCFPCLTLTSTIAGSGTYFGFYTDAAGFDGSMPWQMLPLGPPVNVVQLNFYTAARGGSNPDTVGRASLLTWTYFQAWQIQYFGGTNNPSAAPDVDVTGTGQNNLFKYAAGLDPTNPSSVFVLKITDVAGQPTQKRLTFRPWATARTYTPQYRTDLALGGYELLTGYTGPQTNADAVTVIDTNAVEPTKFYRISITYP
jgi:hypothetical protein